jgi:hypothetical protein
MSISKRSELFLKRPGSKPDLRLTSSFSAEGQKFISAANFLKDSATLEIKKMFGSVERLPADIAGDYALLIDLRDGFIQSIQQLENERSNYNDKTVSGNIEKSLREFQTEVEKFINRLLIYKPSVTETRQ